MGEGYGISCTHCGHKKDYFIGRGFSSPTNIKELIKTNKNQRENDFMQYLMEHRSAELVNIVGYRLYECPKCNTLHSKYHIEINYNYNETYIKHHFCGRCKSYLVPLKGDINITQYRCKKCNNKTLNELYQLIMWD